MSAPNPTGGEREFDALRRAQRAHEPSMEEILASIRAIIADDRAAEPAKSVAAAPKPVASVGPQIVYSKDSPSPLRAVPEPESVPPKTQSAPPPAADAPPPPWRRPPVEALAARRPEPEPQARQDPPPAAETETIPDQEPAIEPPLLSDEADRAVSESFQVLSTSLAFQSDEIEAMTREILRPMIKTWLDEHLPSLVERLVRAEIQRVARGR
jgi:hypothetical protein